ncbi:uncharacterized protein Dvar_80830 [Desulfosarcina variabilis str. Montpellier]
MGYLYLNLVSAHPETAPFTRFRRWATNSNPQNITNIPPV